MAEWWTTRARDDTIVDTRTSYCIMVDHKGWDWQNSGLQGLGKAEWWTRVRDVRMVDHKR